MSAQLDTLPRLRLMTDTDLDVVEAPNTAANEITP